MKKMILVLVAVLTVVNLVKAQPGEAKKSCDPGVSLNPSFSKAAAIQAVMDKFTVKDLPGISVGVYTEAEGWWAGAAGFSKLETKTPMNICNLQYTQSVSKTYMAVAILQLYEQGKIRLDAPMTNYLPKKLSKYIKNADQITIRMLLSHTSGVAEYNSDPECIAYQLLHPTTVFKMEDALKWLENDEPQFAPGSKYRYTNTNFTLLALIADAITGDHAKYIHDKIFRPLGLGNTSYRDTKDYMKLPNLPDSYWDVLNCGRPVNITPLQRTNVATMIGDDGIVCTPLDAVKFMKGLMEGKLLKDSTLFLMQQWVKNDEGRPVYGLGLIRFEEGGLVGYGHGGGGMGAGCILLYVASLKVYVFIATNIGVVWDGMPAVKADEMKNEVLAALLM